MKTEKNKEQCKKYYRKNKLAFSVARGLGIKISEAKKLVPHNFKVPPYHFGK
jgi:hypothetical protein